MSRSLLILVQWLLKATSLALAANEIRGLVLAGPVLYGMYQAGGTAMAIWLGFCSLAGIALSLIVPLLVARKAERFVARRTIEAAA